MNDNRHILLCVKVFEPHVRLFGNHWHFCDHRFACGSCCLYLYRFYVRMCIWLTYLLTYLFTYLVTPWSRVLLEKLTGFQLVKKFPAFYGTRMFISTGTSARHLSLSWASSIQSIPPHNTSWRSILLLLSHLRLGLPSGLFPSGFPTKTL